MHRIQRLSRIALVGAALLVPAAAVHAALVNKSFLGSVAVQGTDVVAYHTESRPVEGSSEHAFEWRGATWRFASAENRDRFAKEPERYAPRYGGYCAYGMAQGYKVDIDPEAWSIVDGQLFLNVNKEVQKQWEADIPGFIVKADAHWERLGGE